MRDLRELGLNALSVEVYNVEMFYVIRYDLDLLLPELVKSYVFTHAQLAELLRVIEMEEDFVEDFNSSEVK